MYDEYVFDKQFQKLELFQDYIPPTLKNVKYISITRSLLKQIDYNQRSIENFKTNSVLMSELSTLKDLVSEIQFAQDIHKHMSTRLWLPPKDLTPEKLYDLIKNSLKSSLLPSHDKVEGVGNLLENLNANISDLLDDESRYFVLEVRREDEYFVLSTFGNEKKCLCCYVDLDRSLTCKCMKVKYCSEDCLQKGKKYHQWSCPIAIKEREVEEAIKQEEMKLKKLEEIVAIQKEKKNEIPSYLICPISHELMVAPTLVTVCGHTFEDKKIREWLKKAKRCPLCKEEIGNAAKMLVKNFGILDALSDYKAKRKME